MRFMTVWHNLAAVQDGNPMGEFYPIEVKDGMCTFRRIGTGGTPGPAARLYVDHLGAKYYDETDNIYPYYILVDDNWKQYPAALEAMLRRATRQSVW